MKTNILIVDDTRDNLRLLQSLLAEQGYLVRPVSRGSRAIAGAQSKPPDLILLDIMMPEMDGYEVCKALKADERTHDIPIIFISALNETFDKIKAFSLGGVDYISKPFQAEEVLARVKTHLSLRHLQKQLQRQNMQLRQSNESLSREIAERKQVEDALKHAREIAETANRAKSTFLANMNHELRSPLNAILGFTQVMARSQNLPPEHREHVHIIRRSGEHLLTLINQVLELSKIEAGRITLNRCTIDLHRLLDDIQDMFSLRAKGKGLYLLVKQDERVPRYICSDDVRLRQVLINLLNNAIKFTEEGRVELDVTNVVHAKEDELESQNVHLQFSIADTGPGIAPEEIDTIFEAFRQAKTGRQSQEGTGLGLPISRKFVQLMGGDIQVASQVGHGTRFTFDIQAQIFDMNELESTVPASLALSLKPGQRASDGSIFRILIVDDDVTNRKLLVELLAPLQCSVLEAENGQEAIEVWKTWHPHLIWMDMRMPMLDGYEATKHIRALAAKGSIPNARQQELKKDGQEPSLRAPVIIALTASSFEEERLEIMATGCDDYLRKPFQEHELFELMSKHLGMTFVYEKDQSLPDTTHHATRDAVLTPEHLSALPPDLIAGLEQGIDEVNVEMLLRVIERIRAHNVVVAETLTELVNNFEYDTISHCLNV